MHKHLICTLLFLGSLCSLSAQMESEVGVYAGISAYQGDLTKPHFDGDHINWMAGLHFRQFFFPQLAVRGGIYRGHITADERIFVGRTERAIQMKNTFWEGSVVFEIHPLGQARYLNQGFFRPAFSPFVFGGGAIVISEPIIERPSRDDFNSILQDTSPLIAIPFGGGIRMNVTEKLTLTAELGPRIVISDYLDGISGNSPRENFDLYWTAGFSALYVLQAGRGRYRYR